MKKISYQDMKNILPGESKESLVMADYFSKDIILKSSDTALKHSMGNKILVRKTVAKKLSLASKKLKKEYPNLSLKVVCGYRFLDVQKKFFNQVKKNIIKSERKFASELELFEEIHKYIAVPEVAGHPTGGAIDITIFDLVKNENLDMGCVIGDFDSKLISWEVKNLNKKQTSNRKLLLRLMTDEGFCPFWGEWWHYSYGDREWAAYYNKSRAVFGSIKKGEVNFFVKEK